MAELDRRGRRNTFEGSGKIAIGLFRNVPCTVKDVSTSGARLGIIESQKLPEKFWLKIAGFRRKRMAQTRWRDGDQVGVEFTLD